MPRQAPPKSRPSTRPGPLRRAAMIERIDAQRAVHPDDVRRQPLERIRSPAARSASHSRTPRGPRRRDRRLGSMAVTVRSSARVSGCGHGAATAWTVAARRPDTAQPLKRRIRRRFTARMIQRKSCSAPPPVAAVARRSLLVVLSAACGPALALRAPASPSAPSPAGRRARRSPAASIPARAQTIGGFPFGIEVRCAEPAPS